MVQGNILVENFLNIPILFFLLGLLAVLCRSNLEIPPAISRLLSLYLLFSIGLQGGMDLRSSGLDIQSTKVLVSTLFMSAIIPLYLFFFLKKKFGSSNAGAIAATFGSVSAITFIMGLAFLKRHGIASGGHMIAALALMESPAIIVSIWLVRYQLTKKKQKNTSWTEIIQDSFFNGSIFLLIGSFVVGLILSENVTSQIKPFSTGIFQGMLALFMLDMGLLVARRFSFLKTGGLFLLVFSIIVPIINALIAIAIASIFQFPLGDAFLFATLSASASYVVVPAAMRQALPDASPTYFVPYALAITFPFNVIFGIPMYYSIIETLWR